MSISTSGYSNNELQGQDYVFYEQPTPVLTGQDVYSLQLSQDAADENRYPVQDGDRTLHLYGSGQATLICAPLKLCVVELKAGERISPNGIHLGDSVRWKATPTVGEGQKTFVILKPTGVELETNLVVITDQHSYDVRLVSQPDVRISKIAWSYPHDTAKAWEAYYKNAGAQQQAVKVEQAKKVQQETIPDSGDVLRDLDFNYTISGCDECAWRPVRVYNNGQQTVVELPDLTGTEAPALLVMNGGSEGIVNYRVLGNRYLVDQLFQQAVLVIGVGEAQQRVVITRRGGKS